MRRETQWERARGARSRGGARRRRLAIVVVAGSVAIAACGGDDADEPAAVADSSATGDQSVDESVVQRDDDADQPAAAPEPTGDQDDVPIPVARFVAAGPGEPNTFGPMCATDIDDRGDDMFRVTAPPDWSWSGRTGGSGPDEVDFETPAGRVKIEFFRSADELSTFGSYVTVGDTEVGTVTLADETFPLVEMMAGEEPALGFTAVPYLGPLPGTGTHEATVVMSSPEPLDPELAASVLSTVRAERCGIVEESAIWGTSATVVLVPRFDPDPLGRTYPADAQPDVELGQFGITYLSLDQISYLLSFDEAVASCVAPLLLQAVEADPMVDTTTISPANAPADLIDDLVGQCS